MGGTPCCKVAHVYGRRCFGGTCHGTTSLPGRFSTALVAPEVENRLVHSSEKDGKNVNWWQLRLIQGAGTMGSPRSETTWRPSRPAASSPDLLPLQTGVGFLPGFRTRQRGSVAEVCGGCNQRAGGQRVIAPRNSYGQDAVTHVLGQEPGYVEKRALCKRGLVSLPRVHAGSVPLSQHATVEPASMGCAVSELCQKCEVGGRRSAVSQDTTKAVVWRPTSTCLPRSLQDKLETPTQRAEVMWTRQLEVRRLTNV